MQLLCNIFQTDGEDQRGFEDVGEVKEEYVWEFSRDFTLLVLIKFSYTQAHYGLDRIGHADNVKNETSRGEAEEKNKIKERKKVWQIPPLMFVSKETWWTVKREREEGGGGHFVFDNFV